MTNHAHGCDLRKGRVSAINQVYHVTTTTCCRHPYFHDLKSGRIVIREIMRSVSNGYTDTLAFVVMPDHLHWLFSLTGPKTLAAVVGAVKSHSARELNVLFNHPSAPVWQSGFYDHALRSDEDVIQVARYIVANPLRAELVDHIGEYPLWDAAWL